jgi:hypothetical protein
MKFSCKVIVIPALIPALGCKQYLGGKNLAVDAHTTKSGFAVLTASRKFISRK